MKGSVGLLCLALLLCSRDAHAYLDPGSGSLVLQAAVAALFAALVAVRSYWSRLARRFRRGKRAGYSEPPGGTSPSERHLGA